MERRALLAVPPVADTRGRGFRGSFNHRRHAFENVLSRPATCTDVTVDTRGSLQPLSYEERPGLAVHILKHSPEDHCATTHQTPIMSRLFLAGRGQQLCPPAMPSPWLV
ncbi:unnamed protein product [Gadus morhua 'NCC']